MTRAYPSQEFIASGKLIARLTHSLAKINDWSMEETMNYVGEQTNRSRDMVYRWQQGRSLPRQEVVERLVRIGYKEAELSREWGEELLHTTYYPEASNLLNILWGPKELRPVPHRLARLEHTHLIGRQVEAKQLQDLLSHHYAAYLITIDGIGGVGKTALALDVAYQSLRASTGEIVRPHIPTFEAIIFVSAKQQYLTAEGLFPREQVHRTLRKIFQEVILTLQRYDIRSTPPQEQPDLVREALGRQHTLLIVDNLETMEDKQEILSFLYELPPTVKVVITTRERAMFSPIRLEQLAEEAALELIEQQTQEKKVYLSRDDARRLYQRIGGIPAALVYAVGQRAAGYSLETILQTIPRADGDVARFCFQGSVEPLRGQKAHSMLRAFALFPQMPLRATVTYVAGLEGDPLAAEEALSQLQRLSLVREINNRFRMLPLTREYALAEMKAYPEFEQQARTRWLEWFQQLTHDNGGHDMEEWHTSYDRLEVDWENLLAVFDWCASHDHYEAMKAFWCAETPGSVIDFTTLYGYWDDRLSWLGWLMEAAESRGDWLTVLDAICSRANTLTLMGRYEEAEELFNRAQRLSSYASLEIQVRLAINHAYLHIFLNHFEKANRLLDEARALMPQLSAPLRTRVNINIAYDHAAVLYWQGDYAAARTAFTEAMTQAKSFGWQSLASYAQNYLADIAIHQEQYLEAERLLEPGLTTAKRNKDKRRISSYERSFAQLRSKQGEHQEALAWAKKARDGFEHLGALREVQKMEELIHSLQPEATH